MFQPNSQHRERFRFESRLAFSTRHVNFYLFISVLSRRFFQGQKILSPATIRRLRNKANTIFFLLLLCVITNFTSAVFNLKIIFIFLYLKSNFLLSGELIRHLPSRELSRQNFDKMPTRYFLLYLAFVLCPSG